MTESLSCKWKASKSPTQNTWHLSYENEFKVDRLLVQIAMAGSVTGNFLSSGKAVKKDWLPGNYFKLAFM
jgi:hypothetical protein